MEVVFSYRYMERSVMLWPWCFKLLVFILHICDIAAPQVAVI